MVMSFRRRPQTISNRRCGGLLNFSAQARPEGLYSSLPGGSQFWLTKITPDRGCVQPQTSRSADRNKYLITLFPLPRDSRSITESACLLGITPGGMNTIRNQLQLGQPPPNPPSLAHRGIVTRTNDED